MLRKKCLDCPNYLLPNVCMYIVCCYSCEVFFFYFLLLTSWEGPYFLIIQLKWPIFPMQIHCSGGRCPLHSCSVVLYGHVISEMLSLFRSRSAFAFEAAFRLAIIPEWITANVVLWIWMTGVNILYASPLYIMTSLGCNNALMIFHWILLGWCSWVCSNFLKNNQTSILCSINSAKFWIKLLSFIYIYILASLSNG